MYINNVLKRFNIESCSPTKASIVKGDKFYEAQFPQNDNEINQMKVVLYALVVRILMNAQVCMWPNIAFIVDMLGWYFSDPRLSH